MTSSWWIQVRSELDRSAKGAAASPSVAQLGTDDYSGIERALQDVGQPASRREAMLFLSSEGRAPICGDVVLVCDDEILATLATRMNQQPATAAARSPVVFGWTMDLVTLNLLTELLSTNRLPPELASVLARHCGEPGRHASSLQEIHKSANSRQNLENRLIAENLIFLEDKFLRRRGVRAFDWLARP